MVLHALDGHILASLDALRLQHLGEGTLTLLAYQSILLHLYASALLIVTSAVVVKVVKFLTI